MTLQRYMEVADRWNESKAFVRKLSLMNESRANLDAGSQPIALAAMPNRRSEAAAIIMRLATSYEAQSAVGVSAIRSRASDSVLMPLTYSQLDDRDVAQCRATCRAKRFSI